MTSIVTSDASCNSYSRLYDRVTDGLLTRLRLLPVEAPLYQQWLYQREACYRFWYNVTDCADFFLLCCNLSKFLRLRRHHLPSRRLPISIYIFACIILLCTLVFVSQHRWVGVAHISIRTQSEVVCQTRRAVRCQNSCLIVFSRLTGGPLAGGLSGGGGGEQWLQGPQFKIQISGINARPRNARRKWAPVDTPSKL